MKDNQPHLDDSADLRRRAEEMLREKADRSPLDLASLAPEELLKILHELRVHQIELEMQNEELQRAQQELGAARERYFNLYDLAPVGYMTLSEHGLILEANLTAAGLLGVARGALVKRPLSHFILKEDQDVYFLKRKQLFESGEPQGCDLRMVKKDGTRFWTHLAAAAAQDGAGAPVCRAVISDITERKLAEQALRESEEKFRVVFNNEIYAICIFDLETLKILDINDAYTHLYGYTREQLLSGMTIHDFTAEHQVSDAATQQAIREGTIFIPLRYHRKRDGTVFPVEIVGGPYVWQGHKVMFALIHDITQRKKSENIIFETTAKLDIALSAANMAWWEMDISTGLVICDKRKAEMLGHSPENFHHYKDFMALVHPDDCENTMNAMKAHFSGLLEKYRCEYRILTKSGEYKWFYDVGSIVNRDSNGVPLKVAGMVIDISERKQAEEDLRLAQQQYQDMFESNTAIKLLIDPVDGAIVKANQAAAEFYGWSTNQLETMKISQINTLPSEHINAEMIRATSMKRTYFEFCHRLASGEIRDVEIHSSPIESARGKLLFSIIHDISQRKRAEEKIQALNAELERQSLVDYLTNTFNRRYFILRGTEEINRTIRSNQPLTLLMLDMDEFKFINDNLGHAAGDLAIQHVSKALKANLRDEDILARLGGDEFAILFPNTPLPIAAIMAERLQLSIAGMVFDSSGGVQQKRLTISIGVAAFTEDMSGIDDLLSKADAAMYHAKNNGRNCVKVYSAEINAPPSITLFSTG